MQALKCFIGQDGAEAMGDDDFALGRMGRNNRGDGGCQHLIVTLGIEEEVMDIREQPSEPRL